MKLICIKNSIFKIYKYHQYKTKFENKFAGYSNGSQVSGKNHISFAVRGC